LHSYKYIAEVQSVLGNEPYQKNPLLIRIETSAGHGAGKSTAKVIEEFADVYSFLTYSMGLKWTN
jgi:prolyl oligopeptidase